MHSLSTGAKKAVDGVWGDTLCIIIIINFFMSTLSSILVVCHDGTQVF